jgi:hypothetical protein
MYSLHWLRFVIFKNGAGNNERHWRLIAALAAIRQ